MSKRRGWILLDYRTSDDVINVSGHRMGTAEVERALVATIWWLRLRLSGFHMR